MKLPFEILYEDKDILVIDKPAGIAVQTGRIGDMDLHSFLKNYLAKKGESTYLAVIHRLDQPVQGLLVFGKNEKAAAKLSADVQTQKPSGGKFAEREFFQKEYLAVVRGDFPEEAVTLTDYLEKEPKGNLSKVVEVPKGGPKPKNAKKAVLAAKRICWEDVAKSATGRDANEWNESGPDECGLPSPKPDWQQALSNPGNSLVKIMLYTGRHHQIRVQMAHAGFPLVGDAKYGGVSDGKALRLCAYHLVFPHPTTGKKMEFWAPPV